MEPVMVVASSDAPGSVSSIEFSSCMSNLAMLLALNDKPMPRVLVMHVSNKVAEQFGVGHPGVIRHNRCDATDLPNYYEVWLVGAPDACDFVLAILGILEDHFLLHFSLEERQRALESIAWSLASDSSLHSTVE